MGQHWYDIDGKPAYTIVGANGKERDTTLRDARKFNYSPSTTTIIAGAAKPGLDNYLQQQLCQAAWDSCIFKGECSTYDIWKRSVVEKSKEHSKRAAIKGTAIHDALEKYYLGGKVSKTMAPIVNPVIEFLKETFGDIKWQPERSFTHKLGFGGKVDMSYGGNSWYIDKGGKSQPLGIVLDFKTKDTDDIKKMIAYDEHGMQTVSYAVGLDMCNARRYNLFISTKVPGLLNLTESADFERDWGMFEALLELWQLRNNYVPRVSK